MVVSGLTRRWRFIWLRLVCLVLLSGGLTLLMPSAYGQLPSLLDVPPPSNSLPPVPSGVTRFGDLEVASVYSPPTNNRLFEVVSKTVPDRVNPPPDILLVEARAADVEGRLRLAFRRLIQAQLWAKDSLAQPPRIDITILNKTPVLQISEPDASRSLQLVTVTEADSLYQGKTRDELAQEWQAILQAEVDRVYKLFTIDTLLRRGLWSLLVMVVVGAITGGIILLRRWLNRRQNFLRQQQQAEDQARSELIVDTAAAVEQGVGPTAEADTPTPARANASAPLNHQLDLLTSLKQQFSLKRRLRFYVLLKWLLFWLVVLTWYLGIFGVAYIFPLLMRYRFWIFSTPLRLLLIWFGIGLAIRISHALIDTSIIERFSRAIPTEMTANPAENQRRQLQAVTITGALEGLATVGLLTMGIIWTLNAFHVSTSSILAGGAILGLAISFGSQSLVKDIVNGSLILLEDQFAVGDVVSIDQDAGVVENVNLRVTQIRNTQGELITIPNGAITKIKNMTRLWSRVDFSIEVAYENDVNQVLTLLGQVATDMYNEPQWRELIIAPPDVLGVDQLSNTGMLLRVWLQTAPMQQWTVGREYRRRIRCAFDQHQIQIGRPEWISYNASWGESNGAAKAPASRPPGHPAKLQA